MKKVVLWICICSMLSSSASMLGFFLGGKSRELTGDLQIREPT